MTETQHHDAAQAVVQAIEEAYAKQAKLEYQTLNCVWKPAQLALCHTKVPMACIKTNYALDGVATHVTIHADFTPPTSEPLDDKKDVSSA